MPNDFIKISRTDTNAIFSGDVLTAVRLTQELRTLLQKLIERGNHQFSTGDFAEFEGNHGVPAGQGQTLFDMLNGTQQVLNGDAQNSQAIALCERVG